MDSTPTRGDIEQAAAGMATLLDGVRVVEIAENLAGPYATQILADFGAEVVKVERAPSGDPARQWGPPFCHGDGTIFSCANRGKRSITCDLRDAGDRERLEALIRSADIVVEALRPGAFERLDFGYERLREGHERLIYASILAYGEEGPLREMPGYDPLMQAHAGLMSVNGSKGGDPVRIGTSVVDMGSGMWLAIALLAALRERDLTGRGRRVTVSLFDTAIAWNAYHLLGYLGDGHVPQPFGTELPMIAPYGAVPTADGTVMIAAGNDQLFQRLCSALDLDELRADLRFASNPERVRHRPELGSILERVTRRYDSNNLLERLRDAGVPCAPVKRIDELFADPQFESSAMIRSGPGPDRYPMIAMPVRIDGERLGTGSAPPRTGQHNRLVDCELEEAAPKDSVSVQKGR